MIGLAGDAVNPALVLGLRHADGILHHLGRISLSFVIFRSHALSASTMPSEAWSACS